MTATPDPEPRSRRTRDAREVAYSIDFADAVAAAIARGAAAGPAQELDT